MSDKPSSLPEPPRISSLNQLPASMNKVSASPAVTPPAASITPVKPSGISTPTSQTRANNLGPNIYSNEDEIFDRLDTILEKSLNVLDSSFQQCLDFSKFLIDNNPIPTESRPIKEDEQKKVDQNEDVMDIDKEINEKDGKPIGEYQGILSEEFIEKIHNDEEFKNKLFEYHRRVTLSQHKALSEIVSKDSNRSIFANIFRLETKELPDIEKKFQRLLNGQYFLKSYENDLIYRSKIVSFIQDSKFSQTNKIADIMDYTDFEVNNRQVIQGLNDKLEDEDEDNEMVGIEGEDIEKTRRDNLEDEILNRDDIQFLDLKIIKSDLYLNYLDKIFKQKLKYKLLNESLIESKSKLVSDSTLWTKRKEELDTFFNVEISNVSRIIEEIKKGK